MSWQGYVDDQLVGSGMVSKAAILGKQGGVWAASKGYNLSQKEQDFITKTAFQTPDSVASGGITLAGFKFMGIRADAEEVQGRKGERGCFLIPTKQAIIVAEYDAPINAGQASVTIAGVANWLKDAGF